jgi:hypothetical protein
MYNKQRRNRCTSQSANVYLFLYFTISSLFIVHLDRPMFILFCILRFSLCLLYISIGQCLSYFVFYDFLFVYCISQSANVYLILYSTIFSLFISIDKRGQIEMWKKQRGNRRIKNKINIRRSRYTINKEEIVEYRIR